MKYFVIILLVLRGLGTQCQTTLNYNSTGNTNLTSGVTNLYYNSINAGSSTYNTSSSAQTSLFGSNYVHAQPGFIASGFSSTGFTHLYCDPNAIDIASFHTNGFTGIPKYSKFEIGLKLPANIQSQINDFLAGSTGLNPYDQDQVAVFCSYDNVGSGVATYYRSGFYYRDFSVQSNNWVEQSTDYKFRVRFAPPAPGTYNAMAYLLVNNTLVATMPFSFTVSNNNNPGHLNVDNGNYRKLQFDNGDLFFGVGQNTYMFPIAQPASANCASSPIPCYPPSDYVIYRNRLTDLVNHKGNFCRIRLDPELGFPVEWQDNRVLTTDNHTLKSLSACLNNYDHTQAQMWELDQVVNLCEASSLYFILTTLEDQDWNIGDPYGISRPWARNPYSALLGDNSTGIGNFFTNTQAKTYFKKMLYYITARWGYSTSLAIWEMVNETDNIDGNAPNSGGNPYNNNATYRSNVDQWTCDMAAYLGSAYPSKPVTTGYGSDAAGTPNCLNVWSSNNYNSNVFNGGLSEGNYNSRAAKSTSYYNAFRPFFFGELGTGDNTIDKNNDKDFHNAIWATTMMGGISCGLYWNDFDQTLGLSHRSNFDALRTFVQRVNWAENFVVDRDSEDGGSTCESNGKRRTLLSFWQRNGAKNYVIGWALNQSSVWINDGSAFINPADYSPMITQSGFSGSSNPYTIQSNNCNPNIRVNDLFVNCQYNVRIFDTYVPTNDQLSSFNKLSNASGNLRFQRLMPFDITSPFYPDYAFIITTISNRMAPGQNQEDTLVFTPGDTLCLNAARLLEKGSYSYSWLINQKQYSSDSLVCINSAQYDSVIRLHLIAENNLNKKEKYYKDYLFKNEQLSTTGKNYILVYPNPVSDIVTIGFTGQKPVNFNVSIQNELGQVLIRRSNQDKISLSSLPNGFYVLKIVSNEQETTVKLIVEH